MFSHSQKVRRLLITDSVLVVCVRVHDDVRKTEVSDSESLWTAVMGSAELSSFMSCQDDTFVADAEIMRVFRN